MKLEDFELQVNDDDVESVQFNEGPAKSRQGGLNPKNNELGQCRGERKGRAMPGENFQRIRTTSPQ